MRKLFLYLFFVLVPCCTQLSNLCGQSIVDTAAVRDSAFQLLFTIPIQSSYLATDNLQNFYIGTPAGQVIQYNKNGQQQFEYNNNRLGPIGKIDVRNPLTILVYYPDLAVIVLLDRNLTEIRQINLWDIDILDPKALALANDNNIWVFDGVRAILKKINQQGGILFESRNLNQLTQQNLNPSFLVEANNLIYLSDAKKGLFVFDGFGQLVKNISIIGIDAFQVIEGQTTFYKEKQLFSLDLNTGEQVVLDLPKINDTINTIKLGINRLYLQGNQQIKIYKTN